MISIVNGSLLNSDADAICHQVNCQDRIGAGIAKAICIRWPDVESEYHKFCAGFKNPCEMLGRFFRVRKQSGQPFDIVSIFGQLNYGRDNVCYTNYDALAKAFRQIQIHYVGKKIAFPYHFGCGLAGGDWDVVYTLMEMYLTGVEVVIYKNEQ